MSAATWPFVKLGDHIELDAGFAFKSARYTESKDDIRLLRGDNIGQGFLKWDGVKRWPHEEAFLHSRFDLRENDVVLAMDRPWIETGLKYACVREADLPCLLVQRVARIRGATSLDQVFLRYVIGSEAFTNHVKSIITGVNVPHISSRDISAFAFILPPMDTQRRIAGILSAYDDLIEVNQRRIAILEEMARRLFDEWFARFRYPGHEAVPLVETELGSVPEGWSPIRADRLIAFDPRTKIPKEGEKLFVPMSALDTASSVISGWETRSGNSGAKFVNGDTLMARITPCLENGKTGLVNFLPEGEGGFGSTEFTVMRGFRVPPSFVYLLARSEAFRATAIKSMGGADGRQRVRTEALEGFEIVCPPADLLSRFAQMTEPFFANIRILADQNTRLRAVRDLLLPKLISGEIDVGRAEEALARAAE
jgi:type I restriction enzyme S subunit